MLKISRESFTYAKEEIQYIAELASHNNFKAKLINIFFKLLCITLKILINIERKYVTVRQKFNLKKNYNYKDIHKQSAETINEKFVLERYPWFKPLTLQPVYRSVRVLIIAEISIPQCLKYRVLQKIKMLKHLQYEATYLSWREVSLCRSALQLHNIIIFYRVPATKETIELINEAKRLKLITFYEIDDLVFDVDEYKKNKNLMKLSKAERDNLLHGALLYQQMLKLCDYCIASTPVLANYMKKFSRQEVYIVENCIDDLLLRIKSDEYINQRSKQFIIIGYGSGTKTHDLDFEVAAKPLYNILKKYSNVKLLIHGYLKLPKIFDSIHEHQILTIPFLPEKEYYASVANFDINIAPLESSVFNDAKSNIKYLEASIFKLPTIASPCDTFKSIIQNGKNGFIASNNEEWENALEKLILSKELRTTIGENAYNTVLKLYDYKHIAKTQLKKCFCKFINNSIVYQKKKKVLLVNVFFSPVSFGGATVVVEQLAKQIAKRKDWDITVVTGFFDAGGINIASEEVVRYEVDGISVIGIKFPDLITPILDFRNENMKKIFKEILKTEAPDIVHFHSIQQLSASIAEACMDMNIPYIITCHDMWWLCEKQFMINSKGIFCNQIPIDIRICCAKCTSDACLTYERTKFLKNIINNAVLLLTPSEYQRQMYINNGISKHKVKVNKNGIIPPKQFIKKHSDIIRFAYVGGKSIHKGYFMLKEIFKDIKYSNYILKIADIHRKIGTGKISSKEWNIKGKLIIDAGYSQENIDEYFAEVDVLLFPSQCRESFGLTVREALIRDCWVISSDCGGPTEDIQDGINGNIVQMNDKREFKNAIEKVLQNSEFLLKSYSNPLKKQIQNFYNQANELLNYYNRVIEMFPIS